MDTTFRSFDPETIFIFMLTIVQLFAKGCNLGELSNALRHVERMLNAQGSFTLEPNLQCNFQACTNRVLEFMAQCKQSFSQTGKFDECLRHIRKITAEIHCKTLASEQQLAALQTQIARFKHGATNHAMNSCVVAHMTTHSIPEKEQAQHLEHVLRYAGIPGKKVLEILCMALRASGKHESASQIDDMLTRMLLDDHTLMHALNLALTLPQLSQGGGGWSLAIAAPPAPIPSEHIQVTHEQVRDVVNDMARLRSELQSCEFERMRHEAYATAHAKTIEDRTKELIAAELRASTCESELAALRHEINMLRNENATLRAGDAKLQQENTALQARDATLHVELTAWKHEIDTLRNENATLRKDLAALETEDATLRNEVAYLRKENSELHKRRSPDDDGAVHDERCLKRANASAPAPAPAHASEDSSA
jgi:FtsZ-binding cell division protein ZapB